MSEVFKCTESHSHSCESVSESLSSIRLLYQVGMSFELNSALVTGLCIFGGGIVDVVGVVDGVVGGTDVVGVANRVVDVVDIVKNCILGVIILYTSLLVFPLNRSLGRDSL